MVLYGVRYNFYTAFKTPRELVNVNLNDITDPGIYFGYSLTLTSAPAVTVGQMYVFFIGTYGRDRYRCVQIAIVLGDEDTKFNAYPMYIRKSRWSTGGVRDWGSWKAMSEFNLTLSTSDITAGTSSLFYKMFYCVY